MPFSANNDVWRFKSTRSAFESRLYFFSCFSLMFYFIYGDSLSLFFGISIINFFFFSFRFLSSLPYTSYICSPFDALLFLCPFHLSFLPIHFFILVSYFVSTFSSSLSLLFVSSLISFHHYHHFIPKSFLII